MKLDTRWMNRISVDLSLGEVDYRLVLVNTGGLRGISETEMTRNIYCLDSKGEVIWQVWPAIAAKRSTDRFTSLTRVGVRITADRFFGDEFEIDPDTGKATHTGWHK